MTQRLGIGVGVARNAFTLIELLVVIAVVVLLLALLLPSLEEAMRQAKVVRCASYQKQIGTGLTAYVADNDDQYPPPSSMNGTWIYFAGKTFDNRQNLVEIAGGNAGELFYCPLLRVRPGRPRFSGASPFRTQFGVHAGAENIHEQGYLVMFLFMDASEGHPGAVFTWDWTESGNPNPHNKPLGQGPYTPSDPNAAILADNNDGNGPDGWQRPQSSSHAGLGPFHESNVLYGDAHVETHTAPEYRVIRLGNFAVSVY